MHTLVAMLLITLMLVMVFSVALTMTVQPIAVVGFLTGLGYLMFA